MEPSEMDLEYEKSIDELREDVLQSQEKTFRNWINNHLKEDEISITNLFEDLRDGRILLVLLHKLSGEPVGEYAEGNLKIYHLDNVETCLNFLRKRIPLKGIEALDIVHGTKPHTLHLTWAIIRHFSENNGCDLMKWVKERTSNYENINIIDFKRSWLDGLAFNALIHSKYPDFFNYELLSKENSRFNLLHAFREAEQKLNVPTILDVDDFENNSIDEKSIMAYIALLRSSFNTEYHHDVDKKKKHIKIYFAVFVASISATIYYFLNVWNSNE